MYDAGGTRRVLCIQLTTVFFNYTRQVVHDIGSECFDVSFALPDPLLWLNNESQSLSGVTVIYHTRHALTNTKRLRYNTAIFSQTFSRLR